MTTTNMPIQNSWQRRVRITWQGHLVQLAEELLILQRFPHPCHFFYLSLGLCRIRQLLLLGRAEGTTVVWFVIPCVPPHNKSLLQGDCLHTPLDLIWRARESYLNRLQYNTSINNRLPPVNTHKYRRKKVWDKGAIKETVRGNWLRMLPTGPVQ